MRVAVLSDIHGNLPALDAVLGALAPYDAVWQLGDVVGYGPQPDEVVARLAAIGSIGVRGNHDAAAIGELSTDAFNDDARTAVEWTAARISAATRRWLGGLPLRSVAAEPAMDLTLVHGSPRDPVWEYLFTSAVARANLSHFETPYCLVGHTHIPLVFREDDGQLHASAPTDRSTLELDRRRVILNPGSVGQPRDGDPRACGMLLDTETGRVEWRRVAYPIEEVQSAMRARGLPVRLVERLTHGI